MINNPNAGITENILQNIGNTPMVSLNRLSKSEGIECELVAKCEFLNPGGSIKDRIGLKMIEEAEKAGKIKPGYTLIEPTAGNTGVGIALAARLKGYKVILTLPEKMSQEKVDLLKALGAQVIRTPTELPSESPDSHFGVAYRLNKEIPNSFILDQFRNPSNPLAHYSATADEILRQTNKHIDYIVMTTGTGGTLSGVARRLKEEIPNVKVIGVDPVGSVLAQPSSLNKTIGTWKVEGYGYDFVPEVLDRSLVDQWIKTEDKESFLMSRKLMQEEGILCGGSSGAATVAAVKIAKTLKKGQRVVVILPDSVRNYTSKILSDQWMTENGYLHPLPAKL